MARFTEKQQKAHRQGFIDDCMDKAWGAACHADWISKSLTELVTEYQKLQAEDKALEAQITANAEGFNGHTVANRNKRNELQKRRNAIANTMKLVATNSQKGAETMQRLLDSVDQNLLLADFAKDWSWTEVEATAEPEIKPLRDVYVLQKDWSDRKAGDSITRDELGDGAIYRDLIEKGVITED
jgi:hypothetical protein